VFFSQLRLPGQRGKGSPWAAIAGRTSFGGHKALLGLVVCAAADNNFSQFTLEREQQWLDVLRVRGS
jgi:hypothetical protein